MSNEFINKYIEPDGKFKYCFVVIVVSNIIYTNPSIVFADSVRKIGSLCDLVVMIDNSIDTETEDLLKIFYNKIIKVDRIELNSNSSTSDKNVILTKIHAFGLVEYKKIFLVDVDTILFTNIDNILVELNTNGKIYKLDKNNTGFLVFEPSNKIYKKALEFIRKNKKKLENEKKPMGYLLSNIFDNIDFLEKKIKIGLNKYDNDFDGIQYIIEKPFLMTSNLSIQERMRLDHFKVWFSYFINIITRYNKIKSYKCVKVSIEVSRYFLASLSRFVINFLKSNKKKKEIVVSNIYVLKTLKNINFYYLDISKEYVGESICYDTNTYDKKDFLKYLNELKETEGKFKKYFNLTDTKKIIQSLKKDDHNLELFFLNRYVRMFPNVFVSLQIEKFSDLKNLDKTSNSDFELKNNLVYSLNIEMDKNILENVLFNIFQTYTYSQRLILLNSLDMKNIVKISIFETINQLDSIDANANTNTFIFFETSSKIRLSSVFFNKNSLVYFNKNMLLNNIVVTQDDTRIINRKNLIKIIYLQSFKKCIYSMYSYDEIENIFVKKYDKNNFTIIDNNSHNMEKIKYILEHKLNFIDIIFTKSSLYENVLKKEKIILNDLYIIGSYWEFEGIKFINKSN
jgi:hypothetical protein